VINMNGQIVRTIAENKFPAGSYKLVWDGKDDSGFILDQGAYFICFYYDGRLSQTSKIIKSNR